MRHMIETWADHAAVVTYNKASVIFFFFTVVEKKVAPPRNWAAGIRDF